MVGLLVVIFVGFGLWVCEYGGISMVEINGFFLDTFCGGCGRFRWWWCGFNGFWRLQV